MSRKGDVPVTDSEDDEDRPTSKKRSKMSDVDVVVEMDESSSSSDASNIGIEEEEELLREEDGDETLLKSDEAATSDESYSSSPKKSCVEDDNDNASVVLLDSDSQSSEAELDMTRVEFKMWDEEEEKYKLLKSDPVFRANAMQFMDIVLTYGNKCVEMVFRAYGRKPTVNEFWNYYLSKKVPRQSWYGSWRVVNPNRRGWPLHYMEKGKVLLNSIAYVSELSAPTLDIKVIEAEDAKYFNIDLFEGHLWQLDPIAPGDDFIDEGISIDEGKKALEITRKFYDMLYFGCDHEDFVTYFDVYFYERLELIHYIDNPSPSAGTISSGDRGKIVAAVKEYHCIRNALQESYQAFQIMAQASFDESESGSQRQNLDTALLTFQMRKDRLDLELTFLLDQTMRKLVGDICKTDNEEGSAISNYDFILVMNSVRVSDLKSVYDSLNVYMQDNADAGNLKIVNNLDIALKYCSAGATIFVTSGNYAIGGLHRMGELGGSLVGIKTSDMDVTIVPTDEIGDIWLLSSSAATSPVTLENMTFVVDSYADKSLSTCVHVSSGYFKMTGCEIRKTTHLDSGSQQDGQDCSITPLVRSDSAEVAVDRCRFVNFGGWTWMLDENNCQVFQKTDTPSEARTPEPVNA